MSLAVASNYSNNPFRRDEIRLSNESIRLSILPELGASLSSFEACIKGEWVEIMRPSPVTIRSFGDVPCFLMAPYPNRIRDGHFNFKGKDYLLSHSLPHALHGYVCDTKWNTANYSEKAATLNFLSGSTESSPNFSFSFPFSAQVNYEIKDDKFISTCRIINTGDSTMPVGCGFHPFFLKSLGISRESVQMRFNAEGEFANSDGIPLPSGPPGKIEQNHDFRAFHQLTTALDHCFTGWNGKAQLRWPESAVELVLEASPNSRFLVIYNPIEENFFALEPQTQMIDGVNFLNRGFNTGVCELEPGKEFSMWYSLKVSSI